MLDPIERMIADIPILYRQIFAGVMAVCAVFVMRKIK